MKDLGQLSYYLPENPRPHTSLRIPGSHTLYIGPASCARRHILYEEEYGDRSHCSSLAITEADVISGSYVRAIGEAAGTLLERIRPRPHILFLVFFCIDDFLGTDETDLLRTLEQQHPDVAFSVDHINPIAVDSPSENTVMSRRHRGLYSFLRPVSAHDRGITFLGNYISLPSDCELFVWLKDWGVSEVRELFRCETYEQYQDMAKSALCLGFRCPGEETRVLFEEELNMPFCFFPPEYDAGRVADYYRELAGLLDRPCPEELNRLAEETAEEARETARLFRIRDITLVLDSSAFLRPFAAAKALVGYGFQVTHIFRGRRIWEDEVPMMEELEQVHHVSVLRHDDFKNLSMETENQSCVAIGSDCHSILHTALYVDVWHDEGYFGFQGIQKLMEQLRREVLKWAA